MSHLIIYLAGTLIIVWGIAHLSPTRNVVAAFGEISDDNRRIITMEWIVEGVALVFMGSLLILITYIDSTSVAARVVYYATAACLLLLAIVSFYTGFKIRFLPFRACPFVLITSALLVILGALNF